MNGEWWIVCVRDVSGGEDHFHGPFRSEDRADAHADKVRRELARHDLLRSDIVDVIVEPITAPADWRSASWLT